MDRPSGPLAAGSQLRGLPENPAHALRRLPPPNIPQVPPIPANLRGPMAGSGPLQPRVSPTTPSPERVLQLAKIALDNALRDSATQAAGASGMGTDIKPGVTIDLSRNNIRELPEEVVDIINHELERLALSHNFLTTFPARFIECSSLRYLNIRNNQIKEFPLTICNIRSLEILDLGRNKLRVLPPEIVKLSSLKVLAVQKNRIQELPLCLADMVSIQVLKLEGNDLTFPPKEVMHQFMAPSPPSEGMRESDHEVALTTHIKRFLRQRATSGRIEIDVTGDQQPSEGTETPRHHIRRAASGRFPIKVNGSEVPDIRSPNARPPPPIPSRSHYRGLSQQSTAMRKPGIMPLTIGNPGERERGRSNSEAAQRVMHERPESRNRRMGIVSKKTELTPLDESQNGANNSSSPSSPGEPHLQRPIYVRRLSILPERRRESKYFDPVVEAAKGILYSVFQVHPTIQMLMSLTGDGTAKRSSLEIVIYNTNSHIEELEQEIQKHDPANHDNSHASGENENVYRACHTLTAAYVHVCGLLMENVDSFVDNGDPRYIRTLLVNLYNSIMEIRVTLSSISSHSVSYSTMASTMTASSSTRTVASTNTMTSTNTMASTNTAATSVSSLRPSIDETIRPMQLQPRTSSRDASMTPTADRHGGWPRRPPGPMQNPTALRVATDIPYSYGGNGRNNSMQMSAATPRSGESFASSTASGGRTAIDYSEEDRQFEAIFTSLVNCTNLVLGILPALNTQLGFGLRNSTSTSQRAREDVVRAWRTLIDKTSMVIRQTEMLKSRMSMIKLKDPAIRTHTAFWSLCNNFFEAWGDLGALLKSEGSKVSLATEHMLRLRPINRSVKDCVDKMQRSPWGYLLRPMPPAGIMSPPIGMMSPLSSISMHAQNASNASLASLASAGYALPAHMANGPGTPQSASFSSAFSGGVFERADALMQYGGLAIPPPRQGSLTHLAQSSAGGSNVPTGSLGEMHSLNGMMGSGGPDGMGGILSPPPGVGIGMGRMNGGKVIGGF